MAGPVPKPDRPGGVRGQSDPGRPPERLWPLDLRGGRYDPPGDRGADSRSAPWSRRLRVLRAAWNLSALWDGQRLDRPYPLAEFADRPWAQRPGDPGGHFFDPPTASGAARSSLLE